MSWLLAYPAVRWSSANLPGWYLPLRGGRRELEPVEAVAGQGQQVAELADRREDHASHALDRRDALEPAQVQLDRLREPGQVVDAQDHVRRVRFRVRVMGGMLVLADERQHARVGGVQLLIAAPPEDRVPLADLDHPPGPVQQRAAVALLGLDVERLVAVDWVHDQREVEAGGIAAGEAGVPVRGPLHGRAHAVTVTE